MKNGSKQKKPHCIALFSGGLDSALAILLMCIRVDVWWWGEEMPMILFGWINLPMLYQFGIWLAGYSLVIYVAMRIWVDDE